MIVFWRRYSAALTGSAERRVTCEKCSCEFGYELVRRGTGEGASLYMLNNAGAQARAQKAAAKRLQRALRSGVDPAACPDCGWYQGEMVAEMRRRRLRPLLKIAVAGCTIGALAAVIGWLVWQNSNKAWDATDWLTYAAWAGAPLAAAVLALLARRLALAGHNPNRDHPVPPAPYPGAPRAYKLSGAAGPSAVAFAAAGPAPAYTDAPPPLSYRRQRPDVLPGGWLTLQLARFAFPPVCCDCGKPTYETSDLNFEQLTNVRVAMCRRCARRGRWRVRGYFAGAALLGWGATAVVAWNLRDETGRYIVMFTVGILIAAICGAAGAVFAKRAAGPVRMRRFESAYNTIQLRFRDPGYADLLADAIARDGEEEARARTAFPAVPATGLLRDRGTPRG